MRKLISLNDTCRILSIGRTKVYEMVNDGTLVSIKIGSRRLIAVDSITNITGEAA
jgi:excisionase family DNA binding protein